MRYGKYLESLGGVGGVQTMLPVLLTEGVHKRGLKLSHLVRMISTNPARIFGLYPQKGSLTPGSDADLVVVDLDKEWTLQADQLFYQNPQSPFIGYEFKGSIDRTILRGTTIYQDGKMLVEPGYGQVLCRKTAFALP